MNIGIKEETAFNFSSVKIKSVSGYWRGMRFYFLQRLGGGRERIGRKYNDKSCAQNRVGLFPGI